MSIASDTSTSASDCSSIYRPTLEEGDVLKDGEYTVVNLISTRGRFSNVYAIKSREGEYACKVSKTPYNLDAADEAGIIVKFDHPNVIMVHDWFSHTAVDDHICIATPLYSFDLEQALNTEQIEPKYALDIILQLCEGVNHIHERGILHTDIKPDNILIKNTVPPVCILSDFGNARSTASATATLGNEQISAREYASPEALLGSTFNEATDVWSTACVVLEIAALSKDPLFGSGLPDEVSDDWPLEYECLCKMQLLCGKNFPVQLRESLKGKMYISEGGSLLFGNYLEGGKGKKSPFPLLDKSGGVYVFEMLSGIRQCFSLDQKKRGGIVDIKTVCNELNKK